MSNIKSPRSTYSNLDRYDLNSILYVSPTQLPGCSPQVKRYETRENYIREDMGSFSLFAAVRHPYNSCRDGDENCGNLAGVT